MKRAIYSDHKARKQTLRNRVDLLPLVRIREVGNLGDLYAESGQTLQGSFSAVSTPIFASK